MSLVNGKVMWAKIQPQQLDRTYVTDERTGVDKETGGTWSIDLLVDSTNEAQLKADGLGHLINIHKKDGYRYIKFKRNEFSKARDGKPLTANTPPKVLDSKKATIPADIEVGNNSTVNISYTTYEGFKGKMYATLQSVQVVNLVEFKRKPLVKDPLWHIPAVEGGYTVDKSNDDVTEVGFEAEASNV